MNPDPGASTAHTRRWFDRCGQRLPFEPSLAVANLPGLYRSVAGAYLVSSDIVVVEQAPHAQPAGVARQAVNTSAEVSTGDRRRRDEGDGAPPARPPLARLQISLPGG